MTDIATVVREFPGVRPLAGLDDCWTWSAGRRFHFTLALTADGMHAMQINCRDFFDPELVVRVLSFAREYTPSVLAAAPFSVVEGFSAPPPTADPAGPAFDVVAAAIPAVHRYHERRLPDLNEVTYAVFPGYRCEFSGLETQREAVHRFDRMLDPADLRRVPSPWVRMRYDNPRTGGGSVGPELGITTVNVLLRELRNLDHADGAFVEFENFRGERRRASWSGGGLQLTGDGPSHPADVADLVIWAQRFVYEGVDSAA